MKRPVKSLRCLFLAALMWSLPVLGGGEILVEAGANIKYLANSVDPSLGASWTGVFFDDSSWSDGVYGIGYDSGNGKDLVQTTVTTSARSIYTRATFNITDLAAVESMAIGADYDDGFVVWINGVEVYRADEMPAGTPLWDTTADSRESSNGAVPDYTPLRDITLAALPIINQGSNTLAIAVYNSSVNSGDLIIVPQLSINVFQVSRGPYLQQGASDSVRVLWRSTAATNSRVRYGASPGNLNNVVDVAGDRWDHDVLLSGLLSGTRYYYSVGNDDEVFAGDDADHFFTTSPPTGDVTPTRVWILGDSGTANSNAHAVANAYRNYAAGSATDLWIMLGDNAYPDGTDNEYQSAVFDMYPDFLRTVPLWSTIGNHDGHTADSSTQSGPYYDIFSFPKAGEIGGVPSGTEAYYSFDYGNIHFICLDSYDTDRSPGGAMMLWLEQDLAATTQDWIVAFWHYPPYSKGSHDSDVDSTMRQMRENALPLLEAAGVDLVLAGHSHSYERSFLLEGHYGLSATLTPAMEVDAGNGREDDDGAYKAIYSEAAPYAGAIYITAGSSGKTTPAPLDHPVMIHASIEELGSVVLDIDGNRLDAHFIRENGTVDDYFSIVKNPDNCPGDSNPLQTDTDNNGAGDVCDDDDDGDGLTDVFEQSIASNPLMVDTDGDDVSDYDEVLYDGDPAYTPGADLNPLEFDTDGDGLGDGVDPDPLVPGVNDGDIAPRGNLDGKIDIRDYQLMNQVLLGLISADAEIMVHGDVYPPGNPDGQLNLSDLFRLHEIMSASQVLFTPSARGQSSPLGEGSGKGGGLGVSQ